MVARGVGSRVTDFALTAAERQCAYGFIENDQVKPAELTAAASGAALGRAHEAGCRVVLVAVDGTSLNLTDEKGAKGFGRVGGKTSTRGLIVQTALAMDDRGTPLGLLGQRYWSRPLQTAPKASKGTRRPLANKETQYWLETIRTAEAARAHAALEAKLLFLMDRGYDNSAVLELMAGSSNLFIVRGEHNRLLWDAESSETAAPAPPKVLDALSATAPIATIEVFVGEEAGDGRVAQLELRVQKLAVALTDPSVRRKVKHPEGKPRTAAVRWPRTLTVVEAVETSPVTDGTTPIRWMLWLNFEANTPAAAEHAVRSYAYRWRIEEFHRLWKSGAMRIEETQARSGNNVERLARMAALVATRLLRITHLARHTPEAPATLELGATEVLVLTQMDPRSPRQKPRPETTGTMAWAVAVIADLGGYTGKSSGGPPGPLVLARGFRRLLDQTEGFQAALRFLEKNRDQW